MTTYKSEQLTPNLGNDSQFQVINSILQLYAKIKELEEQKAELLTKLPKKTPIVLEIEDEEGKNFRTFIVDAPTGHYVTYRELELSMNAKTTKADLKELESKIKEVCEASA